MKTRIAAIVLAFGLVTLLSSFSTETEHYRIKGVWERLGSKKVNYKLDKDVIVVTAHEGSFNKLKLKVTGGKLNMHKMVVVYGNGTRDNIPLRYNFGRGSESRIIDLQGGNRVIKKVIFYYDSKNHSRSRATLHLFGRH